MTLVASSDLLSRMKAHAARAYPEECCGILFGTEGEAARVTLVEETRNVREDERRRRFLIDVKDYLAAERTARGKNLDLLGFYHSHPDHPARPSVFDRENAWPNLHYIVIAVDSGRPAETTSWVLTDDRAEFRQEPLQEG